MKQADLLTATFRQLASAKTGGKSGLNGALHSKDGKEKAEHFREQMRQVSKHQSPVIPKADKSTTQASATTPALDAAAILAELTGDVKPKAIENEQPERDEDTSKPSGDGKQATATIGEWHDPNAALSAMMAKIDHEQQNAGRDVKPALSSPVSQVDPKVEEKPFETVDIIDAADIDRPDVDAPAAKRFTATVESMDTKTALVSKPVVREQETHFEPVQQPTTMQKIVDRMASDLPAVAAPEGKSAAEVVTQENVKVAESRPVRMMTLELDPPNLGTVTIKMRLAGDSVEVHLTADRVETTNLLRKERGALSDAMQSAGYSFDIAAIDHTRAQDANLNNGHSQSQPQQQQGSSDQRGSMSSSNGSQSNGESQGRSSGDGQSGARQNRNDHDQPQTSSNRQQDQDGRRIRSSTVYL
jgi:chemotaxis protein MotD